MERSEEHRYLGLSPFELKNKLIELAKHRGERMMLNAGRGNPNWLALEPRAAFFLLGEFALTEARRVALAPDFGGLPRKRGIAARLDAFLAQRLDAPGSRLLARGIDYARDVHGCDPDRLVGEWVDGVLGDHYPLPVRMLPHAEAIVRAHLVAEVFAGDAAGGPVRSLRCRGRERRHHLRPPVARPLAAARARRRRRARAFRSSRRTSKCRASPNTASS